MSNLHYVVREPKSEVKKPSLLVLLHGYGSNELDLFSFADELPDELLIVSARAPYNLSFGGYAWYTIHFDNNGVKSYDMEEARKSIDEIALYIDEIKKKYDTNPNKTFLLGFSQGAILSYSFSFFYPNKVQHIIALSGYLSLDLLPKDIPKSVATDYYSSHGTVDQVLPIEWARKTKPFLDRLGLKNSYSEYPVGHGVAPQNFFSVKEWIKIRLLQKI